MSRCLFYRVDQEPYFKEEVPRPIKEGEYGFQRDEFKNVPKIFLMGGCGALNDNEFRQIVLNYLKNNSNNSCAILDPSGYRLFMDTNREKCVELYKTTPKDILFKTQRVMMEVSDIFGFYFDETCYRPETLMELGKTINSPEFNDKLKIIVVSAMSPSLKEIIKMISEKENIIFHHVEKNKNDIESKRVLGEVIHKYFKGIVQPKIINPITVAIYGKDERIKNAVYQLNNIWSREMIIIYSNPPSNFKPTISSFYFSDDTLDVENYPPLYTVIYSNDIELVGPFFHRDFTRKQMIIEYIKYSKKELKEYNRPDNPYQDMLLEYTNAKIREIYNILNNIK